MNKNMHKPGRLAAWLAALAILLTCSGALADAVLPEGIEVIEESAFEGCDALKAVDLPKSLRELESRAFAQCKSLGLITVRSQDLRAGSEALGEDQEGKIIESEPGMSFLFYYTSLPDEYGWEFRTLIPPHEKLLAYAAKKLKTDYDEMDCVTFVRKCYREALGITIDASCIGVQQNTWKRGGKRIESIEDLQPGDIICWYGDATKDHPNPDPTICKHVAIYVGEGFVNGKKRSDVFIESSSGAGEVRYCWFGKATYYKRAFMNAWRMF